MPAAPQKTPPDRKWEHRRLFERVREAVFAVPSNFRSDVVIRGVQVTDLFNLNALLGAAIEVGVVSTLNLCTSRPAHRSFTTSIPASFCRWVHGREQALARMRFFCP